MTELTRVSLRHPIAVAFFTLVIFALASAGNLQTRVDVGYRIFLGDSHPAIVELDEHIQTFGGGLPVTIAWGCDESDPCESALDSASLSMAHELEKALWRTPNVRQVNGPASMPILSSSDNELALRRLYENDRLVPDHAALAAHAALQRAWKNTLVSEDGTTGAIVVQAAATDSDATVRLVDGIFEALRPFEERGWRFHLLGDPVDFVVAGGELRQGTPAVVAVLVTIVFLVCWRLTRSWLSALLALLTAGFGVGIAMGSMGWLDWPQVEFTSALPPFILVTGVCNSIHLLARYAASVPAECTSRGRANCILQVVDEIGFACMVSSVTTALGVLSFVTAGFENYVRFGVTASIGVTASLLLSFSILPIIIVRVPVSHIACPSTANAWSENLLSLARFSRTNGTLIMMGAAVLMFVAGVGYRSLTVDVDEQALLGSNSQVVRWARYVNARLRKVDSLEILLRIPEHRSIAEPDVAAVVQDSIHDLESLDGLGTAFSVLDLLKQANSELNGGDPDLERLSSTRRGNAELLLLLEMSGEGVLRQWLSRDERSLRISIDADSLRKSERLSLLRKIERDIAGKLPIGWELVSSGPLKVYAVFVEAIQHTQLMSFLTAAVAIGAVLFLFLLRLGASTLNSLQWSGIALLSSAFPVGLTLGTMGLLDIPLDAGTAMVGAIVLGIAVDDSVHLIVAYFRRRSRSESPEAAMEGAIVGSGRALIITSIALASGFFALLISPWQSIASFGFLSAVAILAALVADLVILPAAVIALAKPTTRGGDGVSRAPSSGERGTVTLLVIAGTGLVCGAGAYSVLTGSGGRTLSCHWMPSGALTRVYAATDSCPVGLAWSVDYFRSPLMDSSDSADTDPNSLLRYSTAPSLLAIGDGNYEGASSSRLEIPVVDWAAIVVEDRLLLAALAAVTLVFAGILPVWLSSSPLVIPHAAFSGTTAIVVFHSVLAGIPGSPAIIGIVASALLACPLSMFAVSLSQLFSRPGTSARVFRWALTGPLILSCLVVTGYFRNPLVWQIAYLLICFSICLAWLAAVVAAIGASRIHDSASVRPLALSVLAALVGLPILVMSLGSAWGASDRGMITASLALAPEFTAYGLIRYAHLDLRPLVPRFIAAAALTAGVAGLVTTLWIVVSMHATGVRPRTLLILVFFCAVLTLDVARQLLWRKLSDGFFSFEGRLTACERTMRTALVPLTSELEIARIVARRLRAALASRGVLIGSIDRGDRALAGVAPALISSTSLIHRYLVERGGLSRPGHEGHRVAVVDDLLNSGVEIAAVIHCSNGDWLLFVRSAVDRIPFTEEEVRLVERVVATAEGALRNSALADELRRRERYDTLGRIGAGWVHEVRRRAQSLGQYGFVLSTTAAGSTHVRVTGCRIERTAAEIVDAVNRLAHLSADGAMDMTAIPVDEIVDAAADAVMMMHPTIRLQIKKAKGLPWLRGGENLRLALVSLLDNGALASQSKGQLSITASEDRGRIRIHVRDNGEGIPKADLSRIWEPGWGRRDGGTGCGLTAAREAILRLGGTIELHSTVGQGTAVAIDLPSTG